MIITVTLNAAIDKTLAVPNFRLGRRHRAVEQTAMAGGKGVNVARALKALGQPVIATGVAGGPTGTLITEALTNEGILNDFLRIREESRTSTAVIDPTSGEQTEINEYGPLVSESELDHFVEKLLYLAKGAAMCVFSGSQPRGVDAGLYGRLIDELRRLGVSTVLDSEGEPLQIATRKGPDLVSPNELEAEGLVGREFADEEDRVAGVAEMVELGARESIMTLPERLPRAALRRHREAGVPGHASIRSSRCPRSAPAMHSWPASWPPATRGAATRTASVSPSPAAPSPPSISGLAWSICARWSGSGRRFASSGSSRPRSAPGAGWETVPRGSVDAGAAVLTSSVRPSSNLGWPNGS